MIKDVVTEIFGGAWPMIVIFTIILSSIRIAFLIIRKEKLVLYKELCYLIFLVYILSLFYIVTFQDDNYGTSNFILFREILRYDIGSKLFVKNIVGNIILYMPFGLFISAYLDSKNIFSSIILTFIASTSIEVVQLIIGRVFDVDDILLNLIGGVLGSVIFVILDNIKDRLPRALKSEWLMNLIIIVLIILGILYFTNVPEYVYGVMK